MLKIGMYRHYWNKFPAFENPEKSSSGFIGISVVVAFRNEENFLPVLLASLDKQEYPHAFREVILVNDHSVDGSPRIAEDFAHLHSGFRCITNEKDESGKKAAVMKGIRHAGFNLIVITDADCRMGENWLSSVSAVYTRQNAGMIIGLVDMETKPGLFNSFQEMEFLSLVASGAAAACSGRPIYCNAANLAFQKDLFLSYADPLSMAVPSGDDTLFMLRVKKHDSSRIVVLKSAAAIVTTFGAGSIGQFLNQRSRWASKIRHYTDRDILYTAFLVLGMSVALMFSFLLVITGKNLWLFPALLIPKTLMDYLFLRDFMVFCRKKIQPVLFVLFEMIYPVYVLISAMLGLFNRYTWKERKYTGRGVNFQARR
jgi:cellulose synthase/poly-beta-1,6-N-acetylglucosamine synthase-like glycosyltransferase